jgi:hypothetical protein
MCQEKSGNPGLEPILEILAATGSFHKKRSKSSKKSKKKSGVKNGGCEVTEVK